MAVEIYTATVKYPADPEPYDAGYGASHNVRLVFDDPSAPKTDGDGEGNVYKKAGTLDAKYMLSLQEGDRVQLSYTMREGKGWYDFIIPGDFKQAPPARSSAPKQQVEAVSHGPVAIEWNEPDETFWEIWERAIQMEHRKLSVALESARELNHTHGSKEIGDAISMALSMYHKASTHAKPGLVLHVDKSIDRNSSLLVMLDQDDLVTSMLNAVVQLSDGFFTPGSLKGLYKELGLSSADIKDDESALKLANIAWEHMDMVEAGASESVATSSVADKYGLLPF